MPMPTGPGRAITKKSIAVKKFPVSGDPIKFSMPILKAIRDSIPP
jgi:hypothetical protein